MDITKNEIGFPYYKQLYESSVEQNIDTDFQLPDYYPEIVKVLKTLTEINVLSSHCDDSGVIIGGQVVLTLLYFGSDDRPNSFTHTVPFTKHIDVNDVGNGSVKCASKLNYLNTKAIGPRKIESHGSLNLIVTVNTVEECSVLTEFDCEGVHYKTSTVNYIKPLPIVSKSVFAEGDIQIPQSKPTVEKILRKCAKASVTECKCSGGKIIVKGNLEIEMLYCPQGGGRPILLTESDGFSQIFDCNECVEDMYFDAFAHVDSVELHPKTSLDGEVRNISYEAKIGIDVSPYCDAEIKLISDAFSGKYSAEISRKTLPCELVKDRVNESFVCKKSVDLGQDTFSDVLDLWCDPVLEFVSTDNNDLLLKGNVIVSILCNDNDGQTVYFERPMDFEYRYDLFEVQNVRCRPEISVIAVQHSLQSDGIIEVEVEISVKATVFELKSVSAIEKISVDFDTVVKKDNDSAVVLYFAENEAVWDIAMKYGTSPQYICTANKLENEDVICNKVLLIPNI